MKMRIWLLSLLSLTVLTQVAGCGSSPFTKKFSMEAVEFQPTQQVEGGPVVAIEPAVISEGINQDRIVVLKAAGVADVQEYKRWVGAPDDKIVQVLAANLSSLVPTERVVALPWRPIREFDYTVHLNVFELGPQADGSIRLSLFWSLTDKDKEDRVFHRASYYQPAISDKVEDAIPIINQLLGQLSRDVAKAIRTLSKQDGIPLGKQ